MSEPQGNKSTEKDIQTLERLRHLVPDRLWVGMDMLGGLILYRNRVPGMDPTLKYMRVLSREEVEKLASDEGVDVQQLINSLHRTIDGQKKHIATLQARVELLTRENGVVANAYLNKMGIDPEEVMS